MPKSITSVFLLCVAFSGTCFAKGPAYSVVAEAQGVPTFAVQGEYTAENKGVQVIARGSDKVVVVEFEGGLPGAGWNGTERKRTEMSLADANTFLASFKKVNRAGATLGASPPEGAVVLFDGTAQTLAKHWQNAQMTDDGLLKEGFRSQDEFKDFKLHLEFLLPFMPEDQGQNRGNSGCYLQGRYEVQLLDSFGLDGLDNECGGIYSAAAPAVNMCFPPLTWQTYDIDFTAARFDEQGNKTANARVTVRHNGTAIHDNLELPKGTPGGVIGGEGDTPGPIFLQNHGDPVRFRNIWVVPRG